MKGAECLCRDVARVFRSMTLAAGWIFLCGSLVHAARPRQAAGQDQPPTDKQDQPPPEKQDHSSSSGHPTVKLRIVVTNNDDKPLANASVYVRFYESGGLLHHDKLAEMNFKTNQDGSVKVPEIPQGKILIQVIATGWHTYGKWYDINQDEDLVTVKLEPPPHWY